jgi:tetratricopeptide (TPR) repeat protein
MYTNIDKYRFHSRKSAKRRRRLIILVSLLGLSGLVAVFIIFVNPLLAGRDSQVKTTSRDVFELWNEGQYGEVANISAHTLSRRPLDRRALIFYGFAQYYLAYYEKALEEKIPLLDEAIFSLRKAKLVPGDSYSSQIDYILGQAYYHKGSFYYDLTIKYIESSLDEGYIGRDTYEYLGLAHGGVGNPEGEVEFFLKASQRRPTDLLLLSVGKAYYKLKDFDKAEDYLLRSLNKTSDRDIEKECRFALAEIYIQMNDFLKAESQYKAIVKLDSRSAVAHFQLGEIYYRMNDIVRARSQWRKTLSIDPTHHGAKLRYYR